MISSFSGDYAFLSNFFDSPVTVEGLTFQNGEAAFQMQKASSLGERIRFCSLPAAAAKKFGRKIVLRDNWDNLRIDAMRRVLMSKFEPGSDLAQKLLSTGYEHLIEGNTWHDNFWGNCICERCQGKTGKNMLGNLLMERREQLRDM